MPGRYNPALLPLPALAKFLLCNVGSIRGCTAAQDIRFLHDAFVYSIHASSLPLASVLSFRVRKNLYFVSIYGIGRSRCACWPQRTGCGATRGCLWKPTDEHAATPPRVSALFQRTTMHTSLLNRLVSRLLKSARTVSGTCVSEGRLN